MAPADIVAAMDQATLEDAGMDKHTRSQLTLIYGRRILLGGKS